MKGLFISVLMVLAMVQFMVEPGQAVITCGQVDSFMAPCIPYLTGGQPVPAAGCCKGVKSLRGATGTTGDRRQACNCIKQGASRYKNIKDDAASALPNKCNTPVSIPISRTVDCNS
ncbi:hypothetical protein HHK36_001521 [Tetracentron sinense]|uniref:Non-specific lipid-transfer protein n=1 Tax=Tetracentron sinense TaxID=13715 RepID=A0A834ZXQ0_TETSI|nr:hypothetical protein HHK36_001521 [Tetracentron sinense]